MVARLLYRDGLMLVLDKPAGFAVHRGPKGGESLEDHFGALRFGLPRAPALAHRLDRDTSGCLVLGRHRKALESLGKLFKQGKVGKTYWALVQGGPAENEGRIDMPLGKRDDSRGWWMKPDPKGQPAVTTWKVMGRAEGKSWLALEPRHRPHASACECIARRAAGRSWAIRSMAVRRAQRVRRCSFFRAKSSCRSTRTAIRSASPRRCRRICATDCSRAAGTARIRRRRRCG